MPQAFVLSQDQTLKFIPGRACSTQTRASKTLARRANIMATLGRRPRIPSHVSTISISNPPRLPPQRGRAYRPTHLPRQHLFLPDLDATRSNRVSAVIKHHGVFCLRKNQPALYNEADGCARDGEPRRNPAAD